MDGVLIIDKPAGSTSHDVVVQVRRILRERRVGHTGTLDPFATGVLVLLVGRATRLAQFMSDDEKEYEAVIRFGYSTDTGDLTGVKIDDSRSTPNLIEADIEPALESLRGEIQQIPPMYSAKKKEGQKLYELARKGIEVERAAVNVCIYKFESIKRDGSLLKRNLDGTTDLKVRVVCSAGTYVRTLAEDLGKRLNTGAHLAELRRTRAGDFGVESALSLQLLKEKILESVGAVLSPPEAALSRMPFVHLTAEDARRARHGMEVRVPEAVWPEDTRIRMHDQGGYLIGVGYFEAVKHLLHPQVVLTTDEK
jgi:tRNA pseudouridine55 synthase